MPSLARDENAGTESMKDMPDPQQPAGKSAGNASAARAQQTPQPSHAFSRDNGAGASAHLFAAGQRVFEAGSGHGLVYIVRSGSVRLYKKLPNDRSINLGIMGPNTVFTQEDNGSGFASGSIAEAMVDSTLSIVPVEQLADLIAASPDLAASLLTGLTRRLTEMQTLVEHLLARDVSVRLAVTFLQLAARFGRSVANGWTAISLPLTHQYLANMIGANRVTVTRKLDLLESAGLIRSQGRNAFAIDTEAIRKFAQTAGPESLSEKGVSTEP